MTSRRAQWARTGWGPTKIMISVLLLGGATWVAHYVTYSNRGTTDA